MNYFPLEVNFNFNGQQNQIYPVIIQDGSENILVDCGYAGFLPLIENAAQLYGISLQNLTGVIITHHDVDHMGGLFELKEKYPSVKIYSSPLEKDYINGRAKSLRLVQAENMFDQLPEEYKQAALDFQKMLKQVRPVSVDITISEDVLSPILHKIKVIHTPGHMPGHISLYLPESKILIAADALVFENGEFDIANPNFTLDLPEAIRTIQKLQQFDIDEIVCYHGGVIRCNIQSKLSRLIAKYCS
jgi:glyoxylase-like metal-dependent hydrolase (beta-lactamase superfamily II)